MIDPNRKVKDYKLLRSTCLLAFLFTPAITIAWKFTYKTFDGVYSYTYAFIASIIFFALFLGTFYSKFIKKNSLVILYIISFISSIALLNEAYHSNFAILQTWLLLFVIFVIMLMLKKTSHLIIFLGIMVLSTIILLSHITNPGVSKINTIVIFCMFSFIGYTHLKFKFDVHKELMEAEILYRNLVESTLMGSFLFQNNKIIYVNPYIENLIGYSMQELSEIDYEELIYPNDLAMLETIKPEESYIPNLRVIKKDGSILHLETHIKYITYNGLPTMLGNILDITHLKNAEEKIKHIAYYDALTQLPNRYMLNDYLNQSLVQVNQELASVGVLFIDLDNFKSINDTYGHKYGDIVLQQASHRLNLCIRKNDIVCRFGGDEFIVVLKNIDRDDCIAIAERIISEFRNEFVIDGKTVSTTPSIGICLYPQDGRNSEDLLMHADAAMYIAKGNGRNNYHFYS